MQDSKRLIDHLLEQGHLPDTAELVELDFKDIAKYCQSRTLVLGFVSEGGLRLKGLDFGLTSGKGNKPTPEIAGSGTWNEREPVGLNDQTEWLQKIFDNDGEQPTEDPKRTESDES